MSSYTPRRAIFNQFDVMAHMNELLKFHGTPKNVFFADLTQKIGMILIHLYQTAMVVFVVTFLFDNLREKRPVPLTK